MELDLEHLRRDWIVGIPGEDFHAQVKNFRGQLEGLSVKDHARGVLISEKDPLVFAAQFFAAVLLDCPVILANPNWGEKECGQLRELVPAALCFDALGGRPLGGHRLSHPINPVDRPDERFQGIAPGSILIPTGGSTGGVKLAIHTWESLEAACLGLQDFLGGGAIDSCCVLPLYHVSGLMQLLRAYHTGGCIRFDAATVAGMCLSYVPTQLQRALADPARLSEIAKARAIFVGGAAMPEALVGMVRELKLPVIPVYGMTETGAMCAAIRTEDFLSELSAGAEPIGETRFWVEDSGRIRIQSPALFRGYHGHPAPDLDEGYLTDDEGYLDDRGHLHVLGRTDRLIISGGEKVDPREVEAAVCRLDGVEEALAVGVPDQEWGQKLIVFYTGTKLSAWKQALSVTLARYKLPKEMIWVDRLPLDERGKFKPRE